MASGLQAQAEREPEEVLEERGVLVDRATTHRWTQRHAPGIEQPADVTNEIAVRPTAARH